MSESKRAKDKLRAGTFRDKRFVAAHRGGPLDLEKHRLLALWAADCAERVLPLFEEHGQDIRPRIAIETARAWAGGKVRVGDAQKAAVSSHAAARDVKSKPASAAARAAGHAVATAHMADHSLGAALYALKAVKMAGMPADAERQWQREHIPRGIRELVLSAIARRRSLGLGDF
jgi:immunity protein 5 of polymorphic toxin system